MAITDKDLLSQGFKEFKPGPFDSEHVEKCFQKCIRDEYGIRYFITVRKWMSFVHPYTGEVTPSQYESSVQLYQCGNQEALDLLFHSNWEMEDIEAALNKIWDTGLFSHYDLS